MARLPPLRRTLFGLLMTTLVLLLAEGVARLLVPEDRLRFRWESPDSLMAIDDQGGLLIAPHARQEQADGPHRWVAQTAAWGLRETEDPSPRPAPGTVRFLALGDSWMFGWNARTGYTLPDVLEELLPARLGVARVEVLNGAIFGSCAFDMLRRWEQLSSLVEVDAVLLGRPHNEGRQESLLARREGWYSNVRGAPFVPVRLYLLARYHLARFTRPQYRYTAGDRDRTSLADLEQLMRDATARGKRVYFVGWPTSITEALPSRRSVLEPWLPVLEELGVAYGGHLLPEPGCWGFEDPNHPSEVGYRAIGEVMADVIATGRSRELTTEPRCAALPGIGPGRGHYGETAP